MSFKRLEPPQVEALLRIHTAGVGAIKNIPTFGRANDEAISIYISINVIARREQVVRLVNDAAISICYFSMTR